MYVARRYALVSGFLAGSLVLVGCYDLNSIHVCNDGLDNDLDGRVDMLDPGCRFSGGNAEAPDPVECTDGIDNDEDGFIDGDDPGCFGDADDDEYDAPRTVCSDGVDNDGDGLIDFPNDPGCFLPIEQSEEDDCPGGSLCPQCANGIDDDGDGDIDFPNDEGCEKASDVDEFNIVQGVCGQLPIRQFPNAGIATGHITVGAPSRLSSPECGGEGSESVWLILVPQRATLQISTASPVTTVDTVVYLRQDCLDPGTELGCNDNITGDVFTSEAYIDVYQPGPYYLIVDNANASDLGGFEVFVVPYTLTGDPCNPNAPTCAPGQTCRPLDDTTKATACWPPHCSDGHDNDGDGKIDFPFDPGCSGHDDTSEGDDDCPNGPTCPECANEIDDDADGFTDFPADIGCGAANDDDEDDCPEENDPILVLNAPISTGSTSGLSNDLNPSTCGVSSSPDQVFALPVYGTLNSLTIDTIGSSYDTLLTVRAPECSDSSEIACDDDGAGNLRSRIQLNNLQPSVYYVVVEGYSSGNGNYVLNVQGEIAGGAYCDPAQIASGMFSCEPGFTCDNNQCVLAECGNGIDDDGDGLTDFPNDPGCATEDDNDEDDDCPSGPGCAECANQVDDDGDGLIDHPADPGCVAAGDDTELNCVDGADPILPLDEPSETGTTTGAGNEFAPSCANSNAPDRVYELVIPGTMLDLEIDTVGSAFDTVLSLKDSACETSDFACNDNAVGTRSRLTLANVPAGTYYAVVDGATTAQGSFVLNVSGTIASGSACDPAQIAAGMFECEFEHVCEFGVCTLAHCLDGMDNDGDGLIDFPDDPGCLAQADPNEGDDCPFGPLCPACSNDMDDDGDGLIDYDSMGGGDPGCTFAADPSEVDECIPGVDVNPLDDAGASGTTPAGSTSNFQGSCNASTTATEVVYGYNLAQTLSTLTFSTSGSGGDTVLYVRDGITGACDDPLAEIGCANNVGTGESVTIPNPAMGNYHVFVDGNFTSAVPYVLNVSGTLAPGMACDPASTQFTCEPGYACDPTGMTCVSAECTDGVDNDGDALIDFPDDPGCDSPSDDDEADTCPGGGCPQCSDGTDNDGDGFTDYPSDVGCGAASDDDESTCPEETDTIDVIDAATETGTTIGLTNDFTPSCNFSNAPDKTFAIRFPGQLNNLTVDTIGSAYDTILAIKTPSCAGPDYACNDDGAAPASVIFETNVVPGVYFIVVDGFSNLNGAFTLNISGEIAAGQRCDPAQVSAGILTCEGATSCTDMGSGFRCQ